MSSTEPLSRALDALHDAGASAGLDADLVRAEGLRLSATVAESSPGASADWLTATGGERAHEFFAAAAGGRRWRTAPTDALVALRAARSEAADAYADALADVATAAATLGRGGALAAQAALEVAASQGRGRPVVSGTTAQPAPGVPATPGAATGPSDPAPLDLTALTASPAPAQAPGVGGYLPTPDLGRGLDGLPAVAEILDALRGGAPAAPPVATAGPQTAADGQAATTSETAAASEAEAEEPQPTLAELMAKLDDLVGLDRAKSQVKRQIEMLRVEKLRTEAGLTKPTMTRHLVFVGNPGTGKTTVARLVSGIYRALGLLSKGHLVEVDRSELVAGYLGQTAAKTSEVVASALGGVLFIDEAYSLSQGANGPDAYGAEAVNTLVKDMEDHRDDLVVIVAGYPEPMQDFIATNPGLESRFSTTITFEDYTDAELRAIFTLMAASADFEPTPEALDRVEEITSVQPRNAGFGNGRYVRNLLDAAIARHAWRLRDVEAPTLEQLRELLPEDFVDGGEEDLEDTLALLAPSEDAAGDLGDDGEPEDHAVEPEDEPQPHPTDDVTTPDEEQPR